jgi:hypothetical protein
MAGPADVPHMRAASPPTPSGTPRVDATLLDTALLDSTLLDTALLDTARCPACGARLARALCDSCGVDLSGTRGRRLWAASQNAAAALRERDRLLGELRTEAATKARGTAGRAIAPWEQPDMSPAAAAPASAPPSRPAARAPSSGTVPSAPQEGWPLADVPSRPARTPLLERIGVQGALLGLGALLLAVAGIAFLVFTWDRLSLGARALVIGGLTLTAMAAAAWLRPRLAETAEAVGAIASVLVLTDAWAVRQTGLLGADRLDVAAYGAAAAVVTATVLVGWGRAARVRAGSIAGVLVGPAAPALVGMWSAPSPPAPDAARALALGLLGSAVVAAARPWTAPGWRAERVILRCWAVASVIAALLACPVVAGRAVDLASVLAAGAVTCFVQCEADGRIARSRRQPRAASGGRPVDVAAWSAATGAFAAAAAAAGAWAGVGAVGAPAVWSLAVAPPAAAATAWAALLAAGRRPLRAIARRPCTSAARGVTVLVSGPAAALAVWFVLLAVLTAFRPWNAELSWSVARAFPGGPGVDSPESQLAAVLGLGSASALLAASRPHRWAVPASVLAVLALVAAPLSPSVPLVAVVPSLIVVSVLTAVAVRTDGIATTVRRAAMTCAVLAGSLAVVVGWAVRELSLPVTVLGVVALAPGRRRTPAPFRPLLTVVAVGSCAVLAGAVAVLVGADGADRLTTGAVTGALLAAVLASVRRPLWGGGSPDDPAPIVAGGAGCADGAADRVADDAAGGDGSYAERLAGIGAGMVAGAIGAFAATTAPGGPDARLLAITLGGLLLACLAAAARSAGGPAPGGPWLALPTAAAVPPLAAGAAGSAAAAVTPHDGRAASLAAAGVLTVLGLLLAVIGVRRPADPRRQPAETGAVVAAVVTLVAGTAAGIGESWLWILWLLLGAAVTADASAADRRRVAWAGWVLLTGSSWMRLRLSDIGWLEAYTVPPALALLAVGGLRLRRDRSAGAYRALLPGLALALVPSVLACSSGSAWRPALLVASAAVAVSVAMLIDHRDDVPAGGGRRAGGRSRATLLGLLVGGVVAAGTGVVRSVAGVVRGAIAVADAVSGVGDTRLPERLIIGDLAPAGLPWYRIEIWSLTAAVVLAVAGWALGQRSEVPLRWRSAAGLPVLVVAAGPTLLAVRVVSADRLAVAAVLPHAVDWAALRAGVVLVVVGCLAALAAWRPREPLLTGRLVVAGVVMAFLAAILGRSTGVGVVEVWSVPVAVVLLAVGSARLRRIPASRSWAALGPGLGILLLPSLWLAALAPAPVGVDLWRITGVVVVTGGVVAYGAARRLQAPVLGGGALLALHAVIQLGPWVARTVAGLPRWTVLAVVGAVLLGLGATYERRLRELRSVRTHLAALR